jgi:3-oxoadipyl-CoA thiolase
MPAAFICDAIRTPIGRYAGCLAFVRPDDLASIPIKALMLRNPQVNWEYLDDVVIGCANQSGEDNRNVARMTVLLSGLSEKVPGVTINRLCASGLDAVGSSARAIMSGEAALIIAGGVESMTRAPLVIGKAEIAFQRSVETFDTTIGWRFINPLIHARYGTDSMPETAENIAELYDISRDDQDAFALRSQQRAALALTKGFFAEEIASVHTIDRNGKSLVVENDEHPRPSTTIEDLANLKPLFRSSGTVTAGNASGVSDGAAALILASEPIVRRHGLIPGARVLGMATAGVAPRVMGMGPVPATKKLLSRLNLGMNDFDTIEVNEAFAGQTLAVLRELGLPDDSDNVNANGGAIALGHPLGMSGARLVLTALHQLVKRGGKRALVTMCVGVGQGVALAIERV